MIHRKTINPIKSSGTTCSSAIKIKVFWLHKGKPHTILQYKLVTSLEHHTTLCEDC